MIRTLFILCTNSNQKSGQKNLDSSARRLCYLRLMPEQNSIKLSWWHQCSLFKHELKVARTKDCQATRLHRCSLLQHELKDLQTGRAVQELVMTNCGESVSWSDEAVLTQDTTKDRISDMTRILWHRNHKKTNIGSNKSFFWHMTLSTAVKLDMKVRETAMFVIQELAAFKVRHLFLCLARMLNQNLPARFVLIGLNC